MPGATRSASTPAEGSGRRRRAVLFAWAAVILGLVGYFVVVLRYPSDRTPAGAYLRVAKAIAQGRPAECFPYVETAAQHAAFTIGRYHKEARDRIMTAYPEPEKSRLAAEYAADAADPDGPDVFARYAVSRGWVDQLRRDLSGVAKVEIEGERATVETSRGTRYPFRRRENGIWGLTLFTAVLVSDAEKAARDAALVERAANDYERANRSSYSPAPRSSATP